MATPPSNRLPFTSTLPPTPIFPLSLYILSLSFYSTSILYLSFLNPSIPPLACLYLPPILLPSFYPLAIVLSFLYPTSPPLGGRVCPHWGLHVQRLVWFHTDTWRTLKSGVQCTFKNIRIFKTWKKIHKYFQTRCHQPHLMSLPEKIKSLNITYVLYWRIYLTLKEIQGFLQSCEFVVSSTKNNACLI